MSLCTMTMRVGGAAAAAAVAYFFWRRASGRAAAASASPSAVAGASPSSKSWHSVCVFCGSSEPKSENGAKYVDASKQLARELVRRNLRLVYGGGSGGIMGHVARTVDESGGVVKGIIPRALAPKEVSGEAVQASNVEITASMHARKARMAALSSAFIALPGGYGTFEELMEMITWTQLGIHRKVVGVLNVAGFYDGILAQIQRAVQDGFVWPQFLDILVVDSDPVRLLDRMMTHVPPPGYTDTWTSDDL